MVFELALSSATSFVDMLVAAANLIGKNPPSKVVILEVTERRTSVQITESRGVVFVKIDIPREIFLKYDISGKELVKIDWPHLERILRRVTDRDLLILKKEDGPVLEITFEGAAIRRFKLPLVPFQRGTPAESDENGE